MWERAQEATSQETLHPTGQIHPIWKAPPPYWTTTSQTPHLPTKKYLNSGKISYEHEEEEESNTSEEEEDSPYKEDYAETICANLKQRRLQKLEEITYDTTLPCAMGPINKEEQYIKTKTARKNHKKVDFIWKGKPTQWGSPSQTLFLVNPPCKVISARKRH